MMHTNMRLTKRTLIFVLESPEPNSLLVVRNKRSRKSTVTIFCFEFIKVHTHHDSQGQHSRKMPSRLVAKIRLVAPLSKIRNSK
jgi:hypothetical protein